MKHFGLSLSEVRSLPDEEYIELAATALWMEDSLFNIIKAGVNQAIVAALGEKT